MRPTTLLVDGTVYWVILTKDPDTHVLKDADVTPAVVIRKNGAATVDSVTIVKRAATTGIYDCEYSPAGAVEGDQFTAEESKTITGSVTASATYVDTWCFTVAADERGTNGANTVTPPTAAANATQVRTELATELGRIDAAISSRSTFAGGAVASVTDPVTVGTNNDKTGYSIAQAFPANFAALGINAFGYINRVVLVDTTATNADVADVLRINQSYTHTNDATGKTATVTITATT